MAVKYSHSPSRADGPRRLAAIPVEIYMSILDELIQDSDLATVERKSILSNMNLVCRLFSALVSPKLFFLVAFNGIQQEHARSELDVGRQRRDSWLKLLAQGEETACALGAFVRELEYCDWIPHDAELERRSVRNDLVRHIQVLPRFPNLKSLRLTRTPISRDFFVALLSLKGLEALCVEHCSFQTPDTPLVAPDGSLPCLKDLEVSITDRVGPYVSALVSLAKTRSLRSLRVTDPQFALAFMKQQVDIPLELLEFPYVPRHAAVLSHYLNRTSSITDLRIMAELDIFHPDESRNVRAGIVLRDTSLPRLRSLHCPWYLLPTLHMNQSISRLNMISTCDWVAPGIPPPPALFQQLKRCSLRELVIPEWMLYHCPVDRYAPKLTQLTVCFSMFTFSVHLERIIQEFCALNHRLSLCSLELQFPDFARAAWTLNLPLQHRVISLYLSRTFTTVKRFALVDSIDWYREADGKKWRPVIHGRESVKALLQLEEEAIWNVMEVADFDGALVALFGDREITAAIARRLSQGTPA